MGGSHSQEDLDLSDSKDNDSSPDASFDITTPPPSSAEPSVAKSSATATLASIDAIDRHLRSLPPTLCRAHLSPPPTAACCCLSPLVLRPASPPARSGGGDGTAAACHPLPAAAPADAHCRRGGEERGERGVEEECVGTDRACDSGMLSRLVETTRTF